MPLKKKLIDYWKSSGLINDAKVISAFLKIPRENFVREEHIKEAYGDYPLSIGEGQTISQPTTVAVMTQALELKDADKVLEVGTGSGYQTAIIATLVPGGFVVSTEIVGTLAESARKNLEKLSIGNVKVIVCDGSRGYEKESPYDKIIITAACPKIPSLVVKQLKEDGIIVAPVGDMNGQVMIKGTKKKGRLAEEKLGNFVFVPLRGRYGY